MGLLDDLRNKADNQRENEAADAERRAKLEACYEETMRPRMIKAFQYLTEFVKHLNYIKLETFVAYPLLPNGALQRLQQQDYKVVIDSSKALKEIKFTMECAIDAPVEFEVFGRDAVLLQVDKIKCYSFRHECKTRKVNLEITSAKFILEGPLPLAVNINADVNESKIKIEIRNFNEPGYAKYVLTADEFDDNFLDRLGKFVIRQERTLFGGEEISEEAKKVIRDKLIVERRIRAQEMLEAEALIKAEETALKERSAKEQIKRAVNTKMAKNKDKLKEMFGKLKKQAGFDSVTTDTTLPPASAPTKQPAPVQPAVVAPKPKSEQPAPVQPAVVAPKSKQPATAVPSPQAPVTQVPANSEQQKQEPTARESKKTQPLKVYNAPAGNPFITPDKPESSSEQVNDLDSKLNQKEDKSANDLVDAKTPSENISLSPEDLEKDLANIMQRDTPAKPEVKSVHDSAGKVEPEATDSPDFKLELVLEHESTREFESETKVEQKPAPDPAIEPEPEPKSELNPDLEPEPNLEPERAKLKETSPSNPSLASESPDIDLSASSSPTEEETDSDVPLTSLFSSSNKKPEK